MPSRHTKSGTPSRRKSKQAQESAAASGMPAERTHSDAYSRTPGNLPLPLNRFIGRERELNHVRERLAKARLLTLTGPGGSGKTRLALEAVSALVRDFPDGIWFVDFAPLTDQTLAPILVASTLGVREQPGRPAIEILTASLRSRKLLVIFDNCEHLIAACAVLAEPLLQFCPELTILATSREPLGAAGEVIWNVPPLALPPSDQASSAELIQIESVQLFVEKASAVMPEFALSDRNAPFVARICRELDGLPLALELAAARCRSLSVQEIARRLGERFSLLTAGQRTAPSRHQTLHATIDWSYALLEPQERIVFQQLAVFAGGWTLAAAEGVCGVDALDTLSHLVDKSLVFKQEKNNEVRYSMLETIREYAREKLTASGEEENVRDRHLDFFLHLAEEAAPWLLREEELIWLARLKGDYDNLRAALNWSFPHRKNEGLRMVSALLQFWFFYGNLDEWSMWAERLVSASEDAPAAVRARSLIIGGMLANVGRDWERAESMLSQGLTLSEQLQDREGIAWSLRELGVMAHWLGDRRRAIGLLDKSLAIFRILGEPSRIGECLLWRADALARSGNLPAAREDFREAFRIFLELGERSRTAWSLGGLGEIERQEGSYAEAARLYQESLELQFEVGAILEICFAIEALANLAAQTHAPDRAARLWGAGEILREFSGTPLPPSYRSDYAPYINVARAELGEKAFSVAWSEGRAMTLEQAVEYARAEPEPRAAFPHAAGQSAPDALTPRELEVLRLISGGLSNREIADQLVLSVGTVKWYTTTIYGKLRVQSRTQAVALAKEMNLL